MNHKRRRVIQTIEDHHRKWTYRARCDMQGALEKLISEGMDRVSAVRAFNAMTDSLNKPKVEGGY